MKHLEYFKSQIERKAGKLTLGPNAQKLFDEIEENEIFEKEKTTWVQQGQRLLKDLESGTSKAFGTLIQRREACENGTIGFDPTGEITEQEMSKSLSILATNATKNKKLLETFYSSQLEFNTSTFHFRGAFLMHFLSIWITAGIRTNEAIDQAIETLSDASFNKSDIPHIPKLFKCLKGKISDNESLYYSISNSLGKLITYEPDTILESLQMLVDNRLKKMLHENRSRFTDLIIENRDIDAWKYLYTTVPKNSKATFLEASLTELLRLPPNYRYWQTKRTATQQLHATIQAEYTKVAPLKRSLRIDLCSLNIWGIKSKIEKQGSMLYSQLLEAMASALIPVTHMAEIGLAKISGIHPFDAPLYAKIPSAEISAISAMMPSYDTKYDRELAAIILACLSGPNKTILPKIINNLEKEGKFPKTQAAVCVFEQVFLQKAFRQEETEILSELYTLLPDRKSEIATGFVNSQCQGYSYQKPWPEITEALIIGGITYSANNMWAENVSKVTQETFDRIETQENVDRVISHIKSHPASEQLVTDIFTRLVSRWSIGENELTVYKLKALLAAGANINATVENAARGPNIPAFWKLLDQIQTIKLYKPDFSLTVQRKGDKYGICPDRVETIDIVEYISSSKIAHYFTTEIIEYISKNTSNQVGLLVGVTCKANDDGRIALQELLLSQIPQHVIEDPATMAAIYNSSGKPEHIEAAILRLIRKGANPLKTYQGKNIFTSSFKLEEASMKSIIDEYIATISANAPGVETTHGLSIEVELS